LIDTYGFQKGDTFTVSQKKDSIILRKEKEEVVSEPPG